MLYSVFRNLYCICFDGYVTITTKHIFFIILAICRRNLYNASFHIINEHILYFLKNSCFKLTKKQDFFKKTPVKNCIGGKMKCRHYQCFMELLYACRVKKAENIENHIFMRYKEKRKL